MRVYSETEVDLRNNAWIGSMKSLDMGTMSGNLLAVAIHQGHTNGPRTNTIVALQCVTLIFEHQIHQKGR
jgi:hypothetical protein